MDYSDGASLDGLQQMVDRLAAQLARSVAIDDAQGRLVVSSRHSGEEDAMRIFAIVHRYSDPRVMAHFRAAGIYSWTEPGRIPENLELQFKARVCCPIRDHGILFGHLFLIDEGVTDAEIATAATTAAQVGRLMYRRLALHEDAQRREEVLIRELVSPDPRARERAARRAVDNDILDTTDPVVVLIVRGTEARAPAEAEAAGTHAPASGHAAGPGGAGPAGLDTLETDLHAAVQLALRDRLRRRSLAWLRPGEAVVLLFGRASSSGREIAGQIAARVVGAGHQVVAGVGPVCSGAGSAAASFGDAALAAQAADLLPELGSVVDVADLGVYRWLLKLPPDELEPSRYPAPVVRLLESGSSDGLLETLETYLDCGGDATRTAKTLHVHRSTLYYRLGRIEEIADVDLRDGAQRLLLHTGLKLRRLVEAL